MNSGTNLQCFVAFIKKKRLLIFSNWFLTEKKLIIYLRSIGFSTWTKFSSISWNVGGQKAINWEDIITSNVSFIMEKLHHWGNHNEEIEKKKTLSSSPTLRFPIHRIKKLLIFIWTYSCWYFPSSRTNIELRFATFDSFAQTVCAYVCWYKIKTEVAL